jgi:NTE family protein
MLALSLSTLALLACTSTSPRPSGATAPLASVTPGSGMTGNANAAQSTLPATKPTRALRVALVLGGGAARGFAHIGVIKSLEAHGIVPTMVVGTSAGAVVASLYASGMNGMEINRLALQMDESALSDWATPLRSRGFLKGIALQDYLDKTLKNRPIEKMAIPLGIVATDLQTGQPILFQRGDTGIAARASCSVPSLFEPVKINGHEYVDGGLVSPVPAAFAHKMGADFVIAVDISARPELQATQSSFDILLQTFAIMGQTIKSYELDKYADVVIRPNLAAMSGGDFSGRNRAILAGEEAAEKIMPDLTRQLAVARERVQ